MRPRPQDTERRFDPILLCTDRLQLPLRVVHSPERAAQFPPLVTLPSRTGAAPFMKPHTQDLLD
jgi:hypothetical protein